MARVFKLLSYILLTVVLVAAIAVFAITRLIDPNDLKPQISDLALKNANLDVRIPGDLNWSFWPNLGFSSGRMEVRIAGDEDLFAAIDSAAISVEVWPLLSGELKMSGLSVDGLEANLIETADGANWEKIGGESASAKGKSDDASSGTEGSNNTVDIPLVIPVIAITNSQLKYASTVDGTDIRIEHLNVNATDVSLDSPFALSLALRYQDQDDIRIDLEQSTTLNLDLNAEQFELNDIALQLAVAGVTSLPVNLSLNGDIALDLPKDQVDLNNLRIQFADAVIEGNMAVAQMSAKPIISGLLQSNRFNANNLLKAIGEPVIETANPAALTQVGFNATLNGPQNSVMANPLSLFLDNTTISGTVGITDIDRSALAFDLTLDAIKVDDYLPPVADTETDTETDTDADMNDAATGSAALLPPLSTEPLIPLADLRPLIVNGKFNANELHYDVFTITNLASQLTANNGVLTLNALSGNTLQGSFNATANMNASTDTPDMSGTFSASNMQVQKLAQFALEEDLFTGVLNTNGRFSAQGNSEKTLADTFSSTIDLTLSQGTLRGVNLHNSLLAGINDLLGAYEMLSAFIPGQESGKLPAELSQDTEVLQLSAKTRVENLVAIVDDISAQLRRGTISGNGDMDLRRETFDFQITMLSPEITDNKYFKDQAWPMRCKGHLQGDAADWCGHDKDGFKAIGKSIASKAAADKVKDKLGIDAEGDTAKEVAKDAAEKKAKEEVNKQLQKGLDKLFGR